MQACYAYYSVSYRPGGDYPSPPYLVGFNPTDIRDVNKGPNQPGFPDALGKANLTTTLSGVTASFSHGSISANTKYVYTDVTPNVTMETKIEGFAPTSMSQTFEDIFPLGLNQTITAGILSKAQEAINEFQGGVFIGEFRETLSMLRRPAASALTLCKRLRSIERTFIQRRRAIEKWYASLEITTAAQRRSANRAYNQRLAALLKLWGQEWLKFRFGVLPLISDVTSAQERLVRLNLERKHKYVAYNMSETKDMFKPIAGSQGLFGWSWQEMVQTSARASGSGGVMVQALHSNSIGDPANWGLQLSNFVPTLYELVPWTWLVDYFTNVNEILNAKCVESGRLVYSWAGLELSYVRTSYATNITYTGLGPQACQVGSAVCTRREVSRWVPTPDDDLIFGYRLEFPSKMQLLNIAALVAALS